ncbi:MAG: class I SAM-dependent methyltransferase [Chloroflexi bacterium]|nr:class I SAM-dependent methyltransferase [Chloroflexota bacterium]
MENMSPRFKFGKNWKKFIEKLSEDQVREAEKSLVDALGCSSLAGKKFIDVGSGSGLFSLAAMRLNADQVHSFDYDFDSVACALALKQKYFPYDARWVIEQGDILDERYIESLGNWDVVYSWGVLHHTGKMNLALENGARLVKPSGKLYIAIYNDQGWQTELWISVKKFYNKSPLTIRWLIAAITYLGLWLCVSIRDFLSLRPFYTYRNYHSSRGMNSWTDVIDWVGGYPFEVATPEQIFVFYRERGFVLEHLKTVQGKMGNNEFVFLRQNPRQ